MAERFTVTHPFHPLHGQELELFEYRHDWSGHRVYYEDEDGRLTSLPATWTSVIPPDPFAVMAGTRAFFRADDLVALVEQIQALRTGGRDAG
ncbi:MAG: DUF5372 family protein [Planctomycetota bacterium]